jgi:hypothetical protein
MTNDPTSRNFVTGSPGVLFESEYINEKWEYGKLGLNLPTILKNTARCPKLERPKASSPLLYHIMGSLIPLSTSSRLCSSIYYVQQQQQQQL